MNDEIELYYHLIANGIITTVAAIFAVGGFTLVILADGLAGEVYGWLFIGAAVLFLLISSAHMKDGRARTIYEKVRGDIGRRPLVEWKEDTEGSGQ